MSVTQNNSSESGLTATGSLSSVQEKWAAVVNDQVVPMPRRKLRSRDILHQAAIPTGHVLVRDFNSPNDVGFEDDALVDLAEGNVFNAVIGCARGHDFGDRGLPKLAFVVNDRWEVTIQPMQTGETLRGLFNIPKDVELRRDFESPQDKPIKEGERIEFRDGPVFITRSTKPGTVTIIVGGTPHDWSKPSITYAEVVTLFDPQFPQHPEVNYSVTYEKGPGGREGILASGGSVKVKDEMEFNVSATGQS